MDGESTQKEWIMTIGPYRERNCRGFYAVYISSWLHLSPLLFITQLDVVYGQDIR